MSLQKTKQVIGETTGRVIFVDAGTLRLMEDSNFHWDNTNKRLGIGITVPTSTLHVNGLMRFEGLTSGATAGYVLTAANAAGDVDWAPAAGVTGGTAGFGLYGGSGNISGNTTVNLVTDDLLFSSTGYSNMLSLDGGIGSVAIGALPTSGQKLKINTTESYGLVINNTGASLSVGQIATGVQSNATNNNGVNYGFHANINTGNTGSAGNNGQNWGALIGAGGAVGRNIGLQAYTYGSVLPINNYDIAIYGFNSNTATTATQTYAGFFDNRQTNTTFNYGVYSTLSGTMATGQSYGLFINQGNTITSGTKYGVYATFSGTATTEFGIYFNGENRNYLSGSLGIGTTNPIAKLHVQSSNNEIYGSRYIFNGASTQTVTYGLHLQNSKSGASTANIGGYFIASGATPGNRDYGLVGQAGIGGLSFTAGSAAISGRVRPTAAGTTSYSLKLDNAHTPSTTSYAIESFNSGTRPSGTHYGFLNTVSLSTTSPGVVYGLRTTVSGVNNVNYGEHVTVQNAVQNVGIFVDATDNTGTTTNQGIQIACSGASVTNTALDVTSGNIIFNSTSGQWNFNVRGDTDANLIFVQGTADAVGFGNPAPITTVDIDGDIAHRSTTSGSLTSNQNNFSTADTSFIRLNVQSGANELTGFANGSDGKRLVVSNIGATNITLKHQDDASSATNRIIFRGAFNVILTPDDTIEFIYDGTTERWRKIN